MATATPDAPGTADARGEHFGTLDDGREVLRWTVENGGLRLRVLSLGGVVQSLETPDRDGRTANLVLGHDKLGPYEHGSSYFGALIGRYGNRIGGASFELDGARHTLPANEGDSTTLHGGDGGFHAQLWDVEPFERDGEVGLTLRHHSPDGAEGFPGALDVRVDYTLTARGEWRIDYTATTDRPTVVNLTQHSYFNLAGEAAGRDVSDHVVRVAAGHYTPVDADVLPTGEIADVAGTPFDFRAARPLGEVLGAPGFAGIDHNLVLDGGRTETPRPVALVSHPASGRELEISTTEPGAQLYTANHLDGSLTGSGGVAYGKHAGVAFETQHFPDSPNRPDFPSTVVRPGEVYRTTTVYAFRAVPADGGR
jgi:aldose 1-epimerase